MDRSASDGREFGITTLQDEDGSIAASNVLTSQEDRAIIVLDIGPDPRTITSLDGGSAVDSSSINTLDEGQTATIKITTESGGHSRVDISVPESLTAKSAVAL